MRQAPVILVLEDHDQARFVIRAVLEDGGFSVIEAMDETEVIIVCKRADQPIDLLVSDVILDGAKGNDVASRISALRPALPILFISGYCVEDLVIRGVLYGDQFSPGRVSFLQKPFAPQTLLDDVERLIAMQGGSYSAAK
jgi:CheY-like chemotaxis protein